MSSGVNGYSWNNATYKALYTQMNANTGALNKEEGIDEDELRRNNKFNETAFKEADKDGSGVLSAAEFENYMALYNSSTINNSATSTTPATTTTPTTTTPTGLEEILEEYDADGNGVLDANELTKYINDVNGTTTPSTDNTTTPTTTIPTTPTVTDNAVLAARIAEISTYIKETAANTTTELGMHIALEFVGDNTELKDDVIAQLVQFATDYVLENPDNTTAVNDIKTQLMSKYNEIKTIALENSPAKLKEEAIDDAYDTIIAHMVDAGLVDPSKEELNNAIAKELKAQLTAEANRYAKAFDGEKEDLKDALETHLENYFNISDSEILRSTIDDYNTAVENLKSVLGADNDRGELNIAAMKFLQSALKEGVPLTLGGKTITDSNIFSTIMSFKTADELKAAMDECINGIETGGTRIESIIAGCKNNEAEAIFKEAGFDEGVAQITSDLSTIAAQIAYLSDTSKDLAKATSAYDTINVLLHSYSYEDEEGNAIDTNMGKLEYILQLMKDALTDIENKIGTCDKYTKAAETIRELEGKIGTAKTTYNTDALKDKLGQVKVNEFKDKIANKKSGYVTASASKSSLPASITASVDYNANNTTGKVYSTADSDIADKNALIAEALTVLEPLRNVVKDNFENVFNNLPKSYKDALSNNINLVLTNVFDEVAIYAINNTLKGTAESGFSFNAKGLIEKFWVTYNGTSDPSLLSSLNNYFNKEDDLDKECIDYSDLRANPEWYNPSNGETKYTDKIDAAKGMIGVISSEHYTGFAAKLKEWIGNDKFNETKFADCYNGAAETAFNSTKVASEEDGQYVFNLHKYVTAFVTEFERLYNTLIAQSV